MFNFTTNGILYSSKAVQDYIQKKHNHMFVTISLDGNKIKHDNQRVYKSGTGSYNDVVKNVPLWLKQFPDSRTKATFSHADLPYLKDSIISLWNLGIKNIIAYIVFENVCDEKDPQIFEQQLVDLGRYVIKYKIYTTDYTVSLFNPDIGLKMPASKYDSFICGSGRETVFIGTDGRIYPCICFANFSQENRGIVISNLADGINENKIKPFRSATFTNVYDKKCLHCKYSTGCLACLRVVYKDSNCESIFGRKDNICKMHLAHSKAVECFWNELAEKENDPRTPRLFSKRANNRRRHRFLLIYIDTSIPTICDDSRISKKTRMANDMILKYVDWADSHQFFPIYRET